jgi:hypothetical protein
MEDSQVVLFADFDSANMARYERVIKSTLPPPTTSTSNQPSQNSSTNNSSNQSSNMNKNNLDNSAIANSNETQSNEKNVTQTANQINKEQSQILPKFDIEFNIWTKPDCDGTPAANSNRSFELLYFNVLFDDDVFKQISLKQNLVLFWRAWWTWQMVEIQLDEFKQTRAIV